MQLPQSKGADGVRNLCSQYYDVGPRRALKHTVPKVIMLNLIEAMETHMKNLFQSVVLQKQNQAQILMSEDSSVAHERQTLEKQLQVLNNVDTLLHELLI